MRRFTAFFYSIAVCLILLATTSLTDSQTGESVPTLVPPTLVPALEAADTDVLPSQSTVARLQANGVVRVGILYNEPPYGEFNIRGEVSGFDADLARKLAEIWGIEVEFVQVTRQNRFEMLRSGDIDMLIAAIVHERQLDTQFEFSQSYQLGRQVMMVRSDDEIATIFNLSNRPIGYVVGTEGEVALNSWQQRTGIAVQPQPYLTLDQALSALFSGDIDGIVARESRLLLVSAKQPDALQVLDATRDE
jgi:ABC-type amino acid transport substrate-binding protein